MATQYSNSKQLLVYQVQPDDRAGWRYEAVDIENGTVLINDWVIASGDFQQIMNGVGSGSIFLPKSDPVIEEAMKQGATKKAVLVRAYLDGLFQYGFFLEFKTDEMTDNGGYLVRFHGAGMESIADDMKIRPKDHPNLPSTVETWIYGSTDNLVSNAALDDTDLPDNPDGSEGNDGEGHPLNWNKRGKLSAYESVYSPGDGYDGRDWYIRFKPSEHHSGLTNTIPITPGKFAHIRAYVREPDGLAQRYTLAVGGDTDIEAYGTVYTNQFEHNNEILAELDNVATGTGGCPGGASDGTWQVMDVEVKAGSEQTSLEISIQHDHHPTCGDFDNSYPELHIGLIEVEAWGVNLDPWETFQDDNHAANSFRRDDLTSYPGTDYSLRLNPLSQFAGTQQTFAVQGNQRYRGEIKAYITTATAGDRIKLELVDPRTNSVLVSDDPELVSGSWVTAAVDYTMPLTIEEIDYRIVYAGPNNPGPIYLSQFSLVPGAPASFPGKILNDIITPIQTRGTHNYLNLDFTDDKDSSGRDWHSKVSMDINPGSSVLDVLNRLVALGYEWRIAPSGYADGGGSSGFNLQVWNSRDIDSTSGMGSRLTGDEDPVIHTGEAITSGDTKIQTRRPNVVYVHGKNGYWTEVFQDDYAAYEAVMGRIEAHIDVGDVQDQSTLADFGKAFLLDEKLREQGFRLSFARTAGIRPYRDFRVGDSVFVDAPPEYPDPDRATERRVRSIHVSTGGEGADIKYEVDFDRVTYRDDAALLAVIAQLSERAPTDTSGEGTGSVSASGSVTISNDGGTVSPHTHAMGDLTGKTLKGDVSGQVDGNIRVNKIKSIPVDVTIPAEVAGQTSYLEYNYANVSFALGQAKIPAVIDDLTDVDLTVAPTNEQALVFDNVSGKWKAADQAGDTADIQVPTVQAVSSEYEGNTSVVVNNNLGGKLDEMYLMLVWCHKNTNGNVINTPTGFTYICEPGDATSDVSVGAFYRIVDGTEPSTWTVSNTVSENMTIRLLRIVNAATVSPIDVVGAEANTISGTSSTVASITTLTDRSLAVSLVGGDVSTAGLFSTASTGWTSSPNEQAYVNASGNWATKPMPAAGATGSVVWTWASGNFGTTNINFAIKPGDGLPTYLEDLTDVRGAPPAPTDGQVLTFDSTTLSWGPEDATGGSSPTTTLGDIIRRGASADERLAVGTNDQVLTVVSGQPAWATNAGGANTVTAGKVSGAELRLTSTQSQADATWADIDWDAEEYDDDDYWEGVTNPERITFAEKGRYEVVGAIIFEFAAVGQRYMRVIRNGNVAKELVVVGPFEGTARIPFAVIVDAAAGDYITIQSYQNSGAALNLTGSGAVGDDAEVTRVQVNRLDVQSGYAGPQMTRVTLTSDFALTTASTIEAIDWDAAAINTNDGWEGVTNPDRLTAWVDGTYRISSFLTFQGDSGDTNVVHGGYYINGSGVGTLSKSGEIWGKNNAASQFIAFNGSDLVELTAGDYVTIVAFHDGTTRNVRDYSWAALELVRLSPDIAVAAIAYQTADNSITAGDGNEELVGLGAIESETPSGVVDTANDTFVAPVDGFYEIGGLIAFGAGPANEVRVSLFLNGTEVSIASSLFRGDLDATFRNAALANRVVKMDAGDTLSVSIWVESTATVRGSSTKTATWLSFKRVTNGAYGNTTPEWLTWDPNWRDSADTALNAGTGVAVESFRYQKVGSTVHVRMDIKIGTSPTLGAGTRWDFDLPYTMNAPMDGVAFGSGAVNEDGAGIYPVWGWLGTAASKEFYLIADDGTPPSSTAVDFDTPFTWATPDTLHFEATYETDE